MGELTWWSFLAFGLLPLLIALIVILSSPAPRDVRRGVLWFVEQVLSFEIRHPFLVMHVALILSGGSLGTSLNKALSYQAEVAALQSQRDPNILALLLSKKFRAERNAWLSAFTFAAWAMLLVTHKVNKEKHELRGQLLALQGRAVEAAQEVGFLGAKREAEMLQRGWQAALRVGGAAGTAGAAGEPGSAAGAAGEPAGAGVGAAEGKKEL